MQNLNIPTSKEKLNKDKTNMRDNSLLIKFSRGNGKTCRVIEYAKQMKKLGLKIIVLDLGVNNEII